jgi:hypothetical protein
MQKAIGIAVLAWLATQTQAQTTPIAPPVLDSYAGKSLAVLTPSPPKLLVYTTAQASGGIAGAIPGLGVLGAAIAGGIAGAATSSSYDKSMLISKTSFADPALSIALALTTAMKSRMDVQVLPVAGKPANDSIESVLAVAPSADWALEVKTHSWSMVYFPTDWSHYRISYRSNLRVLDVASKRVLAESTCQLTQGEKRRPSLDQLVAKDASLLHFYFQQAQFECADQFATKVFGLAALSRPADALTDYRDNLSAGDETAVPDLPKAGQDDYKDWLAMHAPKAFAVGDTVKWGRGVGMKPSDAAAPIDVAMRALHNCKRSYKQNCKLYAVNGKVVEGTDYADRMQALFERGSNLPKTPAQDATTVTADAPTPPVNLTPTGFAKVTEFDLVPYLSDKGRTAYKAWLSKPGPKAFSISPAGFYAEGVGTKPSDATMPTDPVERSLLYCNKYSPTPCKLYAVNGDVVFALEW